MKSDSENVANQQQVKTANEVLENVAKLKKQKNSQQDFASKLKEKQEIEQKRNDDEIFEPPKKHEPTMFMMNNNEPQRDSYDEYLKDVPAYQRKQNNQLTSYGTAALVLAIFAILCSIFLIIYLAVSPDMTDTSRMDFLYYLFFVILAPVIGLIGSVVCSISAMVLGIIAIAKSHKLTISWVGCITAIIALAEAIILAGLYLLR